MSPYPLKSLPTPVTASNRRGFTALELVAVATIIAIISLLLVQSLRPRVEEAREAGVQYEMGKLAGVMTTAYAETNRWFRLQDYDNTTAYVDYAADPTIEVPSHAYNVAGVSQRLAAPQRRQLSEKWNGQYYELQNFMTMGDMNADPYLQLMISNVDGPIFWNAGDGEELDRYPLDPWKNPYIFESSFRGVRIYSLGPNGLPGDETNPTPEHFHSPFAGTGQGVLGTGDDYVYIF